MKFILIGVLIGWMCFFPGCFTPEYDTVTELKVCSPLHCQVRTEAKALRLVKAPVSVGDTIQKIPAEKRWFVVYE